MRSAVTLFLAALVTLFSVTVEASAETAARSATKAFLRAGIRATRCPAYAARLSTGLYTSLQPENTICIGTPRTRRGERLLNSYRRFPFALDGLLRGSAFQTVTNQEGDVNTSPAQEVNYPAAISYNLTNSSYHANYQLKIMNGTTGAAIDEIWHGTVPASGWVDVIGAGNFFFKIMAQPDRTGQQPRFSTSMSFMDQYSGVPASRTDLQMAGVKVTRCPAYFIDVYKKKRIDTSRFTCIGSGLPQVAGLTAAPFNFTSGLYLEQDVSGGPSMGFPFRVLRPTVLNYSISNAEQDGKTAATKIYLVNLSSGKTTKLVDVKGDIISTNTFVNIPGDYYIKVDATPVDRDLYGETDWDLELKGSD